MLQLPALCRLLRAAPRAPAGCRRQLSLRHVASGVRSSESSDSAGLRSWPVLKMDAAALPWADRATHDVRQVDTTLAAFLQVNMTAAKTALAEATKVRAEQEKCVTELAEQVSAKKAELEAVEVKLDRITSQWWGNRNRSVILAEMAFCFDRQVGDFSELAQKQSSLRAILVELRSELEGMKNEMGRAGQELRRLEQNAELIGACAKLVEEYRGSLVGGPALSV